MATVTRIGESVPGVIQRFRITGLSQGAKNTIDLTPYFNNFYNVYPNVKLTGGGGGTGNIGAVNYDVGSSPTILGLLQNYTSIDIWPNGDGPTIVDLEIG